MNEQAWLAKDTAAMKAVRVRDDLPMLLGYYAPRAVLRRLLIAIYFSRAFEVRRERGGYAMLPRFRHGSVGSRVRELFYPWRNQRFGSGHDEHKAELLARPFYNGEGTKFDARVAS